MATRTFHTTRPSGRQIACQRFTQVDQEALVLSAPGPSFKPVYPVVWESTSGEIRQRFFPSTCTTDTVQQVMRYNP